VTNPKELARARKKLNEARQELDDVLSLPRRRGSRIRWPNGVVWERVGDDAWRGTSSTGWVGEHLYPSAHVGSIGPWEKLP
jgi:hypothetical protein